MIEKCKISHAKTTSRKFANNGFNFQTLYTYEMCEINACLCSIIDCVSM